MRADDRTALAFALFAVAYGTNVSTPLLLLYERQLGLTPAMVTALFAAYPVGLVPALLYAGPASDRSGRRTLVRPGLALSAIASVLLIAGANSLPMLFAGRLLLGAVTGMVFPVASAWMQELGADDPVWAARLTGLAMYAGFGLGPLVSGALGEWGPTPLLLPYLVHLALLAGALAAVRQIRETVTARRSGRLRPNLGIPVGSRRTFARVVVPTAFGVFGFPSLAFGLFPVLLRPSMEGIAVFVTGIVGLLAMSTIVPAQAWVARIGPYRAAPIALALGTLGCGTGAVAFATGVWPLLFLAAAALGFASGVSMTAGLLFVDAITLLHERGALTGAFYTAAYAAMTMPLVVSTLARATGFGVALSVVTVAGAALTGWLIAAVRTELDGDDEETWA